METSTLVLEPAVGMCGVRSAGAFNLLDGTEYRGYIYRFQGRYYYETATGKTVRVQEGDGFSTPEEAADALAKRR
jgi:hypothetical protein